MEHPVQPYHHGNLRTALLDKARQHLAEHGPDKISLRALARDIGVSQTAPYRHFPDKLTLLSALAAEGFRLLNEATLLADDAALPVVQRLLKTGRAYVDFALRNPDLYRLMFGPIIPPDTDYAPLDEHGSRSYEMIVQLISKGIETKEFIDGDPLILANSAWSLVHGVASLLIDNRFACTEGEIDERHVEQVLKIIAVGLQKR